MKYVAFVFTALAIAVGTLFFFYQQDQDAARSRVEAGSLVVDTPCGQIEYGQSGTGQPVLVLHGAGGGFDQGLLIGQQLLGENARVIAPSRFGYLNSPIPADASIEAQADAYACLLDALQIDQVHVIAFSAGGPSGMMFASRHPERVIDLITVSAVSYSEPPKEPGQENIGKGLSRALSSDFAYWAFNRFFYRDFLAMVGVPKAVQKTASAQDKADARRLLDYMQPMSLRLAGITLDASRVLPKDRPFDIHTRTLVIHCSDDSMVTVSHAEFIAQKIAGARLTLLASGGHFLFGNMDLAGLAVQDFWMGGDGTVPWP